MKIIHLADTHIYHKEIVGSDPIANFSAVMKHICENHKDADMIIISGDLVHTGEKQSYETLKGMLESYNVKPQMIIGNHDDRKIFRQVFPQNPIDENGFVQYVVSTQQGEFIFLDTKMEGTHEGELCEKRIQWLRKQLKQITQDNKKAFIVMHHPPSDIYVPNTDSIGLINKEKLHEVIYEFSSVIRHIFFGHAHFILSGSFAGVPFSAPRSTSHPSVPEFENKKICLYGGIEPNYNICFVNEESVLVHSMEFLVDEKIQAYTIEDDR